MKPERDAVDCSNPHCTDDATTATPAGPMCSECAGALDTEALK